MPEGPETDVEGDTDDEDAGAAAAAIVVGSPCTAQGVYVGAERAGPAKKKKVVFEDQVPPCALGCVVVLGRSSVCVSLARSQATVDRRQSWSNVTASLPE